MLNQDIVDLDESTLDKEKIIEKLFPSAFGFLSSQGSLTLTDWMGMSECTREAFVRAGTVLRKDLAVTISASLLAVLSDKEDKVDVADSLTKHTDQVIAKYNL